MNDQHLEVIHDTISYTCPTMSSRIGPDEASGTLPEVEIDIKEILSGADDTSKLCDY